MQSTLVKALPYLALIAVVIGAVNFFWVVAESMALGGDALNGYQRDGHYFVGSHGSYTEVGRTAWEWSRVHTASLAITHPLAMVGMAYVLFRFVFPSLIGGQTDSGSASVRVRLVRDSGATIAAGRCAGQIGQMRFSGPLLSVAVFPAGLLIKPLFMRSFVILSEEIRQFAPIRGLFGQRLEIDHAGLGATSPLILYISRKSPLAGAIAGLPRPGATLPAAPPSRRVEFGGPPGLMAGFGVLGLAVNVAIIAIGVFWAIPNLGFFGLIWTGLAIVIGAVNARRLLQRRQKD
jgi:hypothetical protein